MTRSDLRGRIRRASLTLEELGLNFIDLEVPTGAIDGVNAVFTLANAPTPASSLILFKNGVLQKAGGTDFTLAGLTITYVASVKPQVGDIHVCSYRW